ncbi:MAG: hypothetical protein HY923_06985 [Elusimicrobia bacterium]|nr:hypothetical protein [Elusimicrobiota bacterium]
MMTLILATFLTATPAPTQTAQFRPCVWPNTCSSVAAPVVAQVQTCVWPNKCATTAILPVEAAVPVTTCVWPNVCG